MSSFPSTTARGFTPSRTLCFTPRSFYRKLLDDLHLRPVPDPARLRPAVIAACSSPAAGRYRALAVDLWVAGRAAAAQVLQDELLRPGDPAPLRIVGRAGLAAIPDRLSNRRGTPWLAVLALGFVLSMRVRLLSGLCHSGRRSRPVLPAAVMLCNVASAVPEPIVAVHGSNFDLLYYCDHPGWAAPVDDAKFAEHVADAASHGRPVAGDCQSGFARESAGCQRSILRNSPSRPRKIFASYRLRR